MSISKYLTVRKSAFYMVGGLLVFVLYLYQFVGFDEIKGVFERIDPVQYSLFFFLTFAMMLLSLFCDSMAWRELLKAVSVDISSSRAFIYNCVGNFVDLVVPCETVCGEVTRLYLVHKESKSNYADMVASTVSLRLLSLLIAIGGLLFGSLTLIYTYHVSQLTMNLLILMLVGEITISIVIFYLSVKEKATKKISDMLVGSVNIFAGKRFNMANLQVRMEQSLTVFHQGFKNLKGHPRYLIKPVIYLCLSWLLQVGIYILVFYALGFRDVSISLVAVVFSVVMVIQDVSAVFSVGLAEIIMTNIYVSSGIPIAVGGTATTMIRIITFWFQILLGYIIIQWVGTKKLLSS